MEEIKDLFRRLREGRIVDPPRVLKKRVGPDQTVGPDMTGYEFQDQGDSQGTADTLRGMDEQSDHLTDERQHQERIEAERDEDETEDS